MGKPAARLPQSADLTRPIARLRFGLAALAFCLFWTAGCTSVNMNPSYFPYFFPTPYANYDPDLARVELQPTNETVNTVSVGSQHVMLASVYDKYNKRRRGRQVEFMVSGVGSIIDISPTCALWRNKPDQQYAISNTACFEHRLTPNIAVYPGQAWVVLSSPVEGDTHLSVFVPGIHDWDKRVVHTTIRWVDAGWEFPVPAQARAGTAHVLTTRLVRHSDKKPLANYRVRYKIDGGPSAGFLPSKTQEFVAVSDLSGLAQAAILENVPILGTSRISIEVIRPPDPSSPGGSGVVIARGETSVDWLGAAINLRHTGPSMALVGSEVTYETVISNVGKVESQTMTLASQIPDGLQYLRSDPPATVRGQQLEWAFAPLPAGASQTVRTTFKTTRQGLVSHCVDVVTEDGLRDQKCQATNVTKAGLKVAVTGPPSATLGQAIPFNVTVANPGAGPLDNVVVRADFSNGLEFEGRPKYLVLDLQVRSIPPGGSHPVALVLTARQAGPQSVKITATAAGLSDQAQTTVNVLQPRLSLNIDGQPNVKFVGRPAEWTVTVGNSGEGVLSNVVVRDRLPAELSFSSADQGGRFDPASGEVLWNLPQLGPGERRVLKLTTIGKEMGRGAIHAVTASADPNLTTRAEAKLDVLNTPAGTKLVVVDDVDPVEVGKNVTYTIRVTNTGQTPLNQVEVTAMLPPELQLVRATPPADSKKETIADQTITFAAVDGVQKEQTLEYRVEARALRPGDARFRVQLRTQGKEPIREEEATRVKEAAK